MDINNNNNKRDGNHDLEILNAVESRMSKMETMIINRLDKVDVSVSSSISTLQKCFTGLQTQVNEIDKQMALMNERQTKLIDIENKFNQEISRLRAEFTTFQETQNVIGWVVRVFKWVVTLIFSGGFIAAIVNLIGSIH